MKGRGIIFKLGNRCIVVAKDEKTHTEPEKTTGFDVAKTAIDAILAQSTRTTSEYYMHENAEKIYKIAKNSSSPRVRAYAIKALSTVSSKMTSSYYANEISEYIEELV